MAFDNREAHVVFGQQFVQLFPVLDVQDGFQLSSHLSLPSIAFPTGHPRLAALSDVGAVRDDLHVCASTQLTESFDNRLQFHPVVGGFRIATAELFFFSAGGMAQDTGPTAGTGITTAGSVGEDPNEWK